jgi:hypothetical protein
MPKKLPRRFTQRELLEYRQSNADYHRLHRLPEKLCRVCKKVFPNTEEQFRRGRNGWLTMVCVRCAVPETASRMLVGECPVCARRTKLLRDNEGPQMVRVCRVCYSAANRLAGNASDVNERFFSYVRWRRQTQMRQRAQTPDLPPQAIDPEDDEEILDPVDEPDMLNDGDEE